MKKTARLLLFMSANVIYASAMTHIADKRYAVNSHIRKRNQFSKVIMPSPRKPLERKIFFIEPSLCAVVEHNIITMPQICCFYSSVKEAGMVLSNLAQTNKFFNESINNQDKFLALVKHMSNHFDCSNMCITETLSISAAFYREQIQKCLCINILRDLPIVGIPELNRSKKMGLDLDFTYLTGTPLMQTILSRAYRIEELTSWLIENGADINKGDIKKNNPITRAIYYYKTNLMETLLNNEKLNVHHRDIDDNTLLHCCVKAMLDHTAFKQQANNKDHDFMFDVIICLLKNRVNPTIKNKNGKTALEYAVQESGKEFPHLQRRYANVIPQQIIDVLKEAEENWKD